MKKADIYSLVRPIYNEICNIGKKNGVFIIIPMMYIIDAESGEATSMSITQNKKKDE